MSRPGPEHNSRTSALRRRRCIAANPCAGSSARISTALAEPARGGYHRYLGWTLSLLPLPTPWDRARDALAAVGERAHAGHPPGDAELLDVVVRAFGLRPPAVTALLDWNIR